MSINKLSILIVLLNSLLLIQVDSLAYPQSHTFLISFEIANVLRNEFNLLLT